MAITDALNHPPPTSGAQDYNSMAIIAQGATGSTVLALGGTSLLIVVSVVIESVKQIEAQLTMRQYDAY